MQQEPNITQVDSPPKPEGEGWRSIASTIGLLLAAPLIALFLINFVFQSYEVDGPSMESTLQHRDRLIVLKTGKTWSRLTGKAFIPKRGDIVVFNKSAACGIGGSLEKQLIKRVIALPGERVVVKDGQFRVYNEQFPQGFNPDNAEEYGQTIGTTPGNLDIIVPGDEVFVSGDNRVDSCDSRDFGPIPADDIVGTLSLRVFPLNKIDSF